MSNLPFPRNNDFEEIQKELIDLRNKLAILYHRTPGIDPLINKLEKALDHIDSAVDIMSTKPNPR